MEKVARAELHTVAKKVLGMLPAEGKRAVFIALRGELGAGKTTFMQALAKELVVAGIVQSPTYVLMKKYPIAYKQFKTLIHIDAYRLNTAKEFAALKPGQFLEDPATLVCIEWPERIEGALPDPDITVNFSSQAATEGERYIEVV